ncbi:MAG TPA: hypothetical protein VI732_05830 [Alphaproteobacteria bacterium]|jgi:hypothetical protein|nr:hypothetical protein [Alphaproteobacteria bacterium]
MRFLLFAVAIAAASTAPVHALAHGFAGKRFFPATISIDDPFVADELSLPTVSTVKEPASGDSPATREIEASGEFSKRITPEFGISIGSEFRRRIPDEGRAESGFGNVELMPKYRILVDEAGEGVLSAGLGIELGGTGSARVEADPFTTFEPTLFGGKGFGNLPDSVALLRPFAVTGFVGLAIPNRAATSTTHVNEDGDAVIESERHPHVLRYGMTLQYSIPYLQSFVRDVGLGAPFNCMIPIVEAVLETPLDRGAAGRTTATINPGVIWSGGSVQVGVEAIVPVNDRSGVGVGVIGQLHFYLDDIFPDTLGRPIFGGGQ